MKQIEDNIIISPIDGQIVTINYEVGEQTSLAKPIFNLLAQSDFDVEIDISESDINKLKVGNSVEITFDAFGEDQKFQGRVAFIEPAETVIQEVIYYKAKIELINVSAGYLKNIKPGMTANAIIVTNSKKNVLTVPNRAIVDKNGAGKFIRVLDLGKMREIPIETGIRGDNGMIEIISGLEDGTEVITYIKENK
jgi:RND family efflux transporter MFP subunit